MAFLLLAFGISFAAAGFSGPIMVPGPPEDLEARIHYVRETWPDQFAIAVVEALGPGKCASREGTTYCGVRVRPSDFILLRWLNGSPPAPDDEFGIHYWYPEGSDAPGVETGDSLVAFLAPTHGRGTYACTTLMPARPETAERVRKALRDYRRESVKDP